MSAGIIGVKKGMTQIISDTGEMIPVTVVEASSGRVVQKKTIENDGYSSIQVGAGEKRSGLFNKPEKGHFNKAKVMPARFLKEFRVEDSSVYELGQEIAVDTFSVGDFVDVTGTSKGKGFAGAMKRWNFSGQRASHGAEKVHRKVGSIGNATYPGKVFKGKKMPGHMGNEQVTIQNITVVAVRPEDNLIMLKGAVPGHEKGLLIINKSVKKG
jgi:large subunit ribosomal protein L3